MSAGIYLHIPFCKSRCSYCDFATDVYREGDVVERYVEALCAEILSKPPTSAGGELAQTESVQANWPPAHAGGSDIDTIYFGGGTPSLLTPGQVKRIVSSVRETFDITPGAEITMEMNPATVTRETLTAYRELGVNRASFGVQTFNDRDLKLLARGHDANDARQTFQMLRDAGFDNISFDLIAALPAQTLDDWRRNLDEAIALSPEHISLYLLEIHEGTPLAEQIRSERRPMPDEALAAEMFESMLDRLAAAGYEQYEISNFAKPSFQARHNTKYWTLDPVYGFGVSAHSFDGRERFANERDTARYVEMIDTTGSAEVMRETVDIGSEAAFLGLRLDEGIELASVERFRNDINTAIEENLLETDGERLRLTRRGKLFSNEVFAIFV